MRAKERVAQQPKGEHTVRIRPMSLPEVLLIEPNLYRDTRGSFFEIHRTDRYAELGIDAVFVQDNFSRSLRGVLRGLHYQLGHPQGKLVTVLSGRVYDVAVDIRVGSPTFGQWVGYELSGDELAQLYVPPGFAHGFCVLSDSADFLYKCTDVYSPKDERGILWNDPDLAIAWPIATPLLSPKDHAYRPLKEMQEELPQYFPSVQETPATKR